MSDSPRVFVASDLEAAVDDAILRSLERDGYGVTVEHPRVSPALARSAIEAAGADVTAVYPGGIVGRGTCPFLRRAYCMLIRVVGGADAAI
jgi:hypothetical protein